MVNFWNKKYEEDLSNSNSLGSLPMLETINLFLDYNDLTLN
jgi:hypothetical protein